MNCSIPDCKSPACGYTVPPMCTEHADIARAVLFSSKDINGQMKMIFTIQNDAAKVLGFVPEIAQVEYFLQSPPG